LFKIAGIQDLSNATVFAPSEKALSALPSELLEDLKGNPQKLKEFLMYHIATPKSCKCDMEDNKMLETEIENQKLRINTYGGMIPFMDKKPSTITVQCAKLTHLDNEVCGAMIHTVDKVLMPPIGNVIETIQLESKHTTWLDLIKAAGMEEELTNLEGPTTMLAPTNGAFENMQEDLREEIFADQETAAKVVKHHILKEMLCCSGITRNFMFFDQSTKFTMLDDDVVNVKRSNGGYLYADRAELTTCDIVATNGVIHAIDRVLLPLGMRPKAPLQSRALNLNDYGFKPYVVLRNPFKNLNIRFN